MEVIKARCHPATSNEPVVYSGDFRWDMPLTEMAETFARIYRTEKRLKKRAFFDSTAQTVVLPMIDGSNKLARVGELFLKSVTRHVERALELGYTNFIFFPDMGHSHIHIPDELWTQTKSISDRTDFYEKILNHPDVRFLYHTAEQLKLLDENRAPLADRFIQWRLYTRNVVGDNRALGSLDLLFEADSAVNTARGEPGHEYYGGGFNIHSSQNGCFPYIFKGQTYYFDLSFEDLQPTPGTAAF